MVIITDRTTQALTVATAKTATKGAPAILKRSSPLFGLTSLVENKGFHWVTNKIAVSLNKHQLGGGGVSLPYAWQVSLVWDWCIWFLREWVFGEITIQ